MGLVTGTAKVCAAFLVLYVFALLIDGEFGQLRAFGALFLDVFNWFVKLDPQIGAGIVIVTIIAAGLYSQR